MVSPYEFFGTLAVAAAIWGAWGAVGVKCLDERTVYPEARSADEVDARFLCQLFAPLTATYQIVRWALWRYSERGRHEIERRRMERQQELEERYDKMLEE